VNDAVGKNRGKGGGDECQIPRFRKFRARSGIGARCHFRQTSNTDSSFEKWIQQDGHFQRVPIVKITETPVEEPFNEIGRENAKVVSNRGSSLCDPSFVCQRSELVSARKKERKMGVTAGDLASGGCDDEVDGYQLRSAEIRAPYLSHMHNLSMFMRGSSSGLRVGLIGSTGGVERCGRCGICGSECGIRSTD
jgi:hypothetical protein